MNGASKARACKESLHDVFAEKKMEQTNTKTDEKNSKKTKVVLFLFIMPILFLILLAGITVIGIYLAPQDGGGETSQLIGLTTLILEPIPKPIQNHVFNTDNAESRGFGMSSNYSGHLSFNRRLGNLFFYPLYRNPRVAFDSKWIQRQP